VLTAATLGARRHRALALAAVSPRVALDHERTGTGSPPLVFVPGWCCDTTFFEPQVAHFAPRHEVVVLALRGCGRSAAGDGYAVEDHADDVAALFRELGLERPVVAGHSLGGMVALELASRHPSLPGAAVALDPGPIDLLPEKRRAFEAHAAAAAGPDGAAARRALVEGNFLPGDASERRRRIVDTMLAVPETVAAPSFAAVLRWNGAGALQRCAVPLLVLLAQPVGSNAPARLLALKPDTRIGVTVGSGHFLHLEAPDQVNAMIERFLAAEGLTT
jgi:pimeloyl-ACP methyl ester carboxylesterase